MHALAATINDDKSHCGPFPRAKGSVRRGADTSEKMATKLQKTRFKCVASTIQT
jgi:hypothetical protein